MPTTATRPRSGIASRQGVGTVRLAATATSLLIGLVYGLIFAGVLSVGRAEAGELGVLGVAGALFVVLAVLLWRFRSRLLWAAIAILQVLLGFMYIGVAPERDPSYEIWGLTIRALSLVLLVLVIDLLLQDRRGRSRPR